MSVPAKQLEDARRLNLALGLGLGLPLGILTVAGAGWMGSVYGQVMADIEDGIVTEAGYERTEIPSKRVY